ncbi:MAG: DUF4249 family protein, partial [Bacteroidota bacterium]
MRNIFILFLFLIAQLACIDEVDLSSNNLIRVIVVEGYLSDNLEKQIVKLTRSVSADSQIEVLVSGASLFIERSDGVKLPYVEESEGIYSLETSAVPGFEYRLIGTLADGRTVESDFQAIPAQVPVDSVNVIDTLVEFIDESGDRRSIRVLDFYAGSNLDALNNNAYLRYSSSTVFQISEIVCSPFVTPKTCYVYDDIPPLGIQLFQINPSNSPISFESLVYRRRIDFEFGELFALDLSLLSYNESDFKYWERIEDLFSQDGSLTDVRPSRLFGNIETNDGSEVQGQFSVVSK